MALVVEIGVGLPNAESYLSVADFKAYADARGLSYQGSTDEEVEQALRRATEYLDGRFQGDWRGVRRVYTQALAWPRSGAVDDDGYGIAYDALPQKLRSATAEATHRELSSPGSLVPDFVSNEAIKREKFGPVEFEYVTASAANDAYPVVGVIDRLLSGLLSNGGADGDRLFGMAVRG